MFIRSTDLRDDARVKHLVDDLSVLDGAPAQSRLQRVSRLLQDAEGGVVPFIGHREDPREAVRLDGVPRHGPKRARRDPTPPKVFTEPVSDLRGHSFDVLPQGEADPAHRLPTHRNGESRLRLLGARRSDELPGVLDRERMGERVAKIQPDLSVVRVDGQALRVGLLPRPNFRSRRLDSHGHRSTEAGSLTPRWSDRSSSGRERPGSPGSRPVARACESPLRSAPRTRSKSCRPSRNCGPIGSADPSPAAPRRTSAKSPAAPWGSACRPPESHARSRTWASRSSFFEEIKAPCHDGVPTTIASARLRSPRPSPSPRPACAAFRIELAPGAFPGLPGADGRDAIRQRHLETRLRPRAVVEVGDGHPREALADRSLDSPELFLFLR